MSRRNRFNIALIAAAIIMLYGCGKMNMFKPETVITNALESDENLSYYGELHMTTEGMEDLEDVTMREWRQGESSRVEADLPEGLLVTVTDGENLSIYEESEKKAYYSGDGTFQEMMMNPKEALDMIFDLADDTHDIETLGEEKIAGRDTFLIHLTKQKDKKSLLGDQKLWIDKENWMVLKLISITGNIRQEIEYTNIDFKAKVDKSVFDLELPDGVELEDMDNLAPDPTEENIELEAIPGKMKQSVLYFADNQEHQIDTITYTEMETEPVYQDVTIDYIKKNTPLFTLTVSLDEEMDGEDEMEEMLGEHLDFENIRDQKAMVTEFDQLRSMSWSEGGIIYSVELIDPGISWEQVKEWTDEMKEIQ